MPVPPRLVVREMQLTEVGLRIDYFHDSSDEHLLKLGCDLLRGELFCMKQPRQKDVHMAVPETCSHDEALAVDNGRTAWDFDLCSRSNGCNVAVVYEDCAAFDGWFSGGEIDLCANQSQV